MPDALLSQRPVDRLIREIIATRRPVQADEIDQVVERIATAPFDPEPAAPVRMKHRGMTYQGHTLGARASALTYHLVKRVVDDGQWAFGTTSAEYLADLREAARIQDGRLGRYAAPSENSVHVFRTREGVGAWADWSGGGP
jgi:hypothetical protein